MFGKIKVYKKELCILSDKKGCLWIEIRLKGQTLGKEDQYPVVILTTYMKAFSDSIFRGNWDSPCPDTNFLNEIGFSNFLKLKQHIYTINTCSIFEIGKCCFSEKTGVTKVFSILTLREVFMHLFYVWI